jgi:hypothetical protein
MLLDTDLIEKKLSEANKKLIELREKIKSDKNEGKLILSQMFTMDVGISEMMTDFMPTDELVEFLNHTGEDWVKVGLCGHLMQLSSAGPQEERYKKGEQLLLRSVECIKENRVPEFFENEINYLGE